MERHSAWFSTLAALGFAPRERPLRGASWSQAAITRTSAPSPAWACR